MPLNTSSLLAPDGARRLPAVSVVVCLLGLSCAAPVLAADAGDAAAGAKKNSMCIGCHGIPDYHTAFPEVYRVPRLGGQHQAYLVSALKQYRAGDRSHPTMRAIAGSLSDADIANLAAYYAAGTVRTASK